MPVHTILTDAGQVLSLITAAAALWHSLTHKHPRGPA